MPKQSVKFYDNERLDRVDADALQALVYAHIGDVMGALLGDASGCLSPPPVSFSVTGPAFFVNLGPFSYMRSVPDLSSGGFGRTWRTEVIPVDTASGSQIGSVDYTTTRAYAVTQIAGGVVPATSTGAFPFLWAKPYDNDEETAARRKWDTAGASEVPFSSPTRVLRRSGLTLSLSQPGSAADPWAAIGKIVDWPNVAGADAGDPLIVPLTIWDDEETHAVGGYPGNWHSSAYGSDGAAQGIDVTTLAYAAREGTKVLDGMGGDLTEAFDGSKLTQKSMGLVQLLAFTRSRIRRILTSVGDLPWWWAPAPGHDLQALTSASSVNTAAVAAIAGQPLVWFSGYVFWDGANYVVGGGSGGGAFNIATAVKGTTGIVIVTPAAGLPSGKVATGIVAAGNTAAAGAVSVTYPTGSGGSTTVDLVDAAGTHVDGSFHIIAYRGA